jgi:short-subunit dehydrogenase
MENPVGELSDALRKEVRQFGIQVVMIEPGLIGTAFLDRQNALLASVLYWIDTDVQVSQTV